MHARLVGGHIPYRDSKLTRILQPSLGGNAKTAIICAITPAMMHTEESHSTLRFACRAKRVVNNACVNEVLSDAAVLKRQAKEIEELRRVLDASGCGPPEPGSKARFDSLKLSALLVVWFTSVRQLLCLSLPVFAMSEYAPTS